MSGPNRQEALRVFERALEVDDPESIDAKIGIAGTLVADIADVLRNTGKDDEARAERLLSKRSSKMRAAPEHMSG